MCERLESWESAVVRLRCGQVLVSSRAMELRGQKFKIADERIS